MLENVRLSRLFNRDENCVIIATDHGEFDGPIPGMENLPETLKKINPEVDGILLSPGMLKQCGRIFGGKGAPLAIVRLNWGTVYCFEWGYKEAHTVYAFSAKDAIRSGADVVLVSLTLQSGSEERDARNVELFCRMKSEAEDLGIPVIGEVFPADDENLKPEELHDNVLRSCRIISELGANLIKTFYTHRFSEVTSSCPIPILGLGASKLPTQLQALQLAKDEITDGARGVVFGRNAIQVKDPFAFQAALLDVVKRGVEPEEAVAKHKLED